MDSGTDSPPLDPPRELLHLSSGKVRDIYALDDDHLVLVASDRISAYDFVLDTPIPDKGRLLTALSAWWFDQLADLVPHHLVSAEPTGLPEAWRGRAMVVRRLDMLPVECVARGYVTGSGLADVRATGLLGGQELPRDLPDGSRLDIPVFTPATKAEVGAHDVNIAYDDVVDMVGADTAARLRRLTLAVYTRGAERAAERGIVLADTKVEFGLGREGELVLGDEVLTPDSSRFWPAETWQPGRAQPSYDKQYVRDWLASPASGWDRHGGEAPPPLPDDVVERTRARYIEAYERLTGRTFS